MTERNSIKTSKMSPEILYQTMCKVYQFMAVVNLKKNEYHILHKEDYMKNSEDGRFDDLFEEFLFTVCADDQKYLIQNFSRKNIIEFFNSDENNISVEVRRKNSQGEFVWVELRGIKMENIGDNADDSFVIIVLRELQNKETSDQGLQRKYAPMLKGIHSIAGLFKITDDNAFLISATADYFEFLQNISQTVDLRNGLYADAALIEYHARNQAEFKKIFSDAAERKKISAIHSIKGKNNKTLWLKIDASKVEEQDGFPVYFVFCTDVTEIRSLRTELELERERYKLAVEISESAVFEYDIINDVFCAYEFDSGVADYIAPYISKFRSTIHTNNYIHPDDIEDLSAVVCDGRDGVAEFRACRHGDDKYHWFQARCGARVVEKGKAVRVVGTFSDIDDIKHIKMENIRLQKNEVFLKEALDKIVSDDYDYALCIDFDNGGKYRLLYNGIDDDFFCEDANNLWHDAFCDKFSEYLSKKCSSEEMTKLSSNITMEAITAALSDKNEYVLYFKMPSDFGIVYKKLNFRYFNTETKIVLMTCIDITQLREEEAYTKQVLMDALHNAQFANNAKTDFLSRMSHDIRTPLNAIIGITDIVQEKPISNEEIADYFDKIKASSKYLLALINDILDVSQIESGRLLFDVQRFSLDEFLREIADIMNPQAVKKGIDFTITKAEGLSTDYSGDYLRINQILINLLSNALRFTDSGGSVNLNVAFAKTQEDVEELVFVVSDNGIGMSEEFMRVMYDPFEQENKETVFASNSGSGLGLAIVKNLVDLMGGTIEVRSNLGKGTSFTVRLPLSPSKETLTDNNDRVSNVTSNENRQLLAGKQILLVEDNELNREIAKTLLEFKGIIVDTAENGQIALEKFTKCNEGTYAAILMDIRMPVMNGLEATAKIRQLSRLDAHTIPIIALTANAFESDKYQAHEVGMTAYLTKPIDKEALYRILADC